MEIFETKCGKFLLTALENFGMALTEIRDAFLDLEVNKDRIKKARALIADNVKAVNGLYKLVKSYKLHKPEDKQQTAKKEDDENLPYPKEYANALAGMKPSDFDFLKSIMPDALKGASV